MENDNIRLARRWFEEVWNQRRDETIDELLTDESICRSDTGTMRGSAEFRDHLYSVMVDAFPDIRVVIEAMLADGDDVVVRWTATGTHLGHGLGFEATGRAVSFRGMTWLRYRESRMAEGWQVSNQSEVIRSLRESAENAGAGARR